MARGEKTDGSRKTEYAWDTLASEEVHVGYKEDWPDDANRNQDWRGVTPLRTGAEKAEHGDGSAKYRCCENPECASAVSVAQKAVNKWHFRRTNDSRKPPVCERREHYVGESSYHWKTTLQIKKLLEHKMRTKTEWLGRTIMHVEREKLRFFSTGKFGARLKPDIYVRFTDGDWLVVEVVYTHAPDRDNHDAYNHSFSSSNRFGPRIIELNLNQFIDGRITDKSHAQWVREGGMEEALAFESELENRTERFENRKMKFDERERRKRNRAVESAVASCHADFPGLSHLTPEISNDEDLQAIEDFFVNSHRIHTVFGVLVEENGTDFGLDPQQMNSVEDVKASFKEFEVKLAESRETVQTLTQKISEFEQTYPGMHLSPGLTELQDPLHFIESLGVFEETLRQKEKAIDEYTTKAEEITKHIKLKINQASKMGVPQGILDQMQHFKIDLEQYSGNLITMFDEDCKSKYVRALSKEYGIQLPTVLEGASVEEIWAFHQNATEYREACTVALLEKLNAHDISVNIHEELFSQFSEIPLNYNDLDLEKYNQKIEAAIRKWEIDIHVEKCEEHHEIIVPEKVEFDSKELVDEWFAESVEYRDKCEKFRYELLDEMERSGKNSKSYQVELVTNERPHYGERSFDGFKAKLERLKNQKSVGLKLVARDKPFNPFAPDASTQRNKRQIARRSLNRSGDGMSELAKKQKEAMDRMKRQSGGSKPTSETTPEPLPLVTRAPLKPSPTHEERMAELRRKSKISRDKAKLKADKRKVERAKKREQKKSSTSPSPKANTKAPSKPKVTRSPEEDFERAQNKEAAARKQREQDRASKAEKKTTKKKATPVNDKEAYVSELRRRVGEVDRTARLGGKASRKAQRDLVNFKKANKGKYEDDES